MRHVAQSLLLCVLSGCLAADRAAPDGDDPIDSTGAELGVPITGCASGGYANNTLTLTVGPDVLVLNAPAGKIIANGYQCMGVVSGVTQPLTTINVSKLRINGDSSSNKVVLDMQPGTFGTKILANTGGITVDFESSAGGSDSFMIRGGKNPETYKFGTSTTSSDIYIEVSGDRVADIDLKPGASLSLLAAMGGGSDTVLASPLATDFTTFANVKISVGPLTKAITAYGGAGDDKFTGGTGDDVFYGGDGNDTFRATAYPDGNDSYTGDLGTDTVDYSIRTAALNIDIGPDHVSRAARADMGKLDYSTLAGKTLVFALDGGSDIPVTFTTPANPADVISQIDTAAGASVASLTGKNQLVLSSTTQTTTSSVKVDASSTAIAAGILDMPSGTSTTVSGTNIPLDNDDGQSGESDDVRSGIENITGGSGNDTLVGDLTRNVIKGGGGDDSISGGPGVCAPEYTSANGDSLQGEAGNDTFYMPVANCWASLSGGLGNNIADFSARSVSVDLSNNGVANDGAMNEKANIGTDVLKLIGGFGNDVLTGGSSNDTFVGGSGGDVMIGGAGLDDIVDYSTTTTANNISLCFTATIYDCGTANDGAGGATEGDQVFQIEHVIGGSDVDTMTVLNNADFDVFFEGRDGNDVLTGGDGNDKLWGDDGVDTLSGGNGDDSLNGGAGADILDAGGGNGDLCAFDPADSPTPIGCEG
ncbi:MAG TPA: calcium-binding protein [Polyangiales bacterium]|nr:calcium-binding protein [Polyangiales bacterium]